MVLIIIPCAIYCFSIRSRVAPMSEISREMRSPRQLSWPRTISIRTLMTKMTDITKPTSSTTMPSSLDKLCSKNSIFRRRGSKIWILSTMSRFVTLQYPKIVMIMRPSIILATARMDKKITPQFSTNSSKMTKIWSTTSSHP